MDVLGCRREELVSACGGLQPAKVGTSIAAKSIKKSRACTCLCRMFLTPGSNVNGGKAFQMAS